MTRLNLNTLSEFNLIYSFKNGESLTDRCYPNFLESVCVELGQNITRNMMFCMIQVSQLVTGSHVKSVKMKGISYPQTFPASSGELEGTV